MGGAVATYAFINAKLRARISKILPESAIDALARAGSLQESFSLLRPTAFSFVEDIYNRTGDLKLAEVEMLRREIALYADVGRHLSGILAEFTAALALRYEIDNLKNALRIFFGRAFCNRSEEATVHYILHERICNDIDIDRIVNAESAEQVEQVLAATPYGEAAAPHLRELTSGGSLFRLEIALDRLFYSRLLEKSRQLDRRDRAVALRLIGVEIDLQNINWILRLKNVHGFSASQIAQCIIPREEAVDTKWIQQAYDATDLAAVMKNALGAGGSWLGVLLAAQPSDPVARAAMLESILEQILLREIGRVLASYPFTIGIILC
jgi:V/A-type H+-transporting ATPase subunit C